MQKDVGGESVSEEDERWATTSYTVTPHAVTSHAVATVVTLDVIVDWLATRNWRHRVCVTSPDLRISSCNAWPVFSSRCHERNESAAFCWETMVCVCQLTIGGSPWKPALRARTRRFSYSSPPCADFRVSKTTLVAFCGESRLQISRIRIFASWLCLSLFCFKK